MSSSKAQPATLPALNEEVRALVRLAGAIAGSPTPVMRAVVEEASRRVRPVWAEEVILQSYLFAGFPRALNAMREWRRATARGAPDHPDGSDDPSSFVHRGEETCRLVYGAHYDKLRQNIRALHPALDAWMISEGYGKVLSRGALDLLLRELCIVAACAVTGQERQLRSHLLGARNVGASAEQIEGTLDAIADLMGENDVRAARELWQRLQVVASG